MRFEDFRDRIKTVYSGKFNKSACNCYIFRGLGKHIYIDCYLAENLEECENRIIQNDAFHVSFVIHLSDKYNGEELPDSLILENSTKSFRIKPENPYMYCGGKSVAFRKTKGDAEKVISSFGKFIDRFHDSLMAEYEADNLMEHDRKLITKKYFK